MKLADENLLGVSHHHTPVTGSLIGVGDDQLQPRREDVETSTEVVALASERATPTEQATGLGKLAGKLARTGGRIFPPPGGSGGTVEEFGARTVHDRNKKNT